MSNACKLEPVVTVERLSVVVDMHTSVYEPRQCALLVTQANGGYTKQMKCAKVDFLVTNFDIIK